jgi:hypothetical protein
VGRKRRGRVECIGQMARSSGIGRCESGDAKRNAGHSADTSGQAFAQNIRKALAQYPADRRDHVVLLFSAHSLPIEIVKCVGSFVFFIPPVH